MLHSGMRLRSRAAWPTENMTRLSILKSAAREEAEPIAMPRSLALKKQGTFLGLLPQVGKPHAAQFKPRGLIFIPNKMTAPHFKMFSASRLRNAILRSSASCFIFSAKVTMVSSVATASTRLSVPLALGAVRAAHINLLAMSLIFSLRICSSKVIMMI